MEGRERYTESFVLAKTRIRSGTRILASLGLLSGFSIQVEFHLDGTQAGPFLVGETFVTTCGFVVEGVRRVNLIILITGEVAFGGGISDDLVVEGTELRLVQPSISVGVTFREELSHPAHLLGYECGIALKLLDLSEDERFLRLCSVCFVKCF